MFALMNFKIVVIDWRFIVLFLITLTLSSRLSLMMPRSNFAISFSDVAIFLAFLLFSGETAIILAPLEVVVCCFYLKYKGENFPLPIILLNFGVTALSTAITYIAWQMFPKLLGIPSTYVNTSHLITTLGILATFQFLSTSLFAAIFHSLRNDESVWQSWRRECFSSSMMQIVGACLAGIIYKLTINADIYTTIIALAVVGIGYVNYRHIIGEINETIEQAEQAERDKGEVERIRAEQAEKHAKELQILLEKEEQISQALLKSKIAFQHSAMHDTLTGLANRASFGGALRDGIENCQKSSAACAYVLFLDISRFKNINDALGHTIGDKVLIIIAKRISRLVSSNDVVARLGGDEFAIILNNSSCVKET